MPEFVLDNIEKILVPEKHQYNGLGFFQYPQRNISVHSLEKLPIQIENRPLPLKLPRIEPVAIYWPQNIFFDDTRFGWRMWLNATSPKLVIGAILGIWDRDKEISILEGYIASNS